MNVIQIEREKNDKDVCAALSKNISKEDALPGIDLEVRLIGILLCPEGSIENTYRVEDPEGSIGRSEMIFIRPEGMTE